MQRIAEDCERIAKLTEQSGSARCLLLTQSGNDPDFWRSRGEEILTTADNMQEAGSRAVLLRSANDYERIARFAWGDVEK